MKKILFLLLLLAAARVRVVAQAEDNEEVQLWPDVTVGLRLSPRVALQFFGTVRPGDRLTRQVSEQAGVAVNVRLNKFLTVVPAYRAIWSQPEETRHAFEHRYFADIVPRLPLGKGFSIQDRNRFERRDINNQWAWRYRNRVQLERLIKWRDHSLTPYLSAEIFYDSRSQAWNRKQFWAGMRVPVSTHVILDLHYARNLDERARPSRWHIIGVMTRMEF
jgi:hypothetical protein